MDFTPSSLLDYDPRIDARLWVSLCAGETSALGQLYDRHASTVYGISLKMLSSAQEAEDLTQDIFIELVERRKFDPARGSLRTFLLMLTRSRALDRLRSRQTTQRSKQKLQTNYAVSESATVDITIQSVLEGEQTKTVKSALSQLSDVQQQALHLAYYEGLSQTDIASRLEVPLGTIKARTRRGLLKLRELLILQQQPATQLKHIKGEREQ